MYGASLPSPKISNEIHIMIDMVEKYGYLFDISREVRIPFFLYKIQIPFFIPKTNIHMSYSIPHIYSQKVYALQRTTISFSQAFSLIC